MNRTHTLRRSKLALGLIAALAAAPVFAQSTSSGVGGQVTGANGQPVAGAEVTITHVQSGTVSRVTTDANGRYSARGLRVGGPYTITVNKAGEGSDTENNVYLPLDQAATVNAQLGSAGATTGNLDTVTVVGTAEASVFTQDNKGVSTNLSQRDLQNLPAPNRSIQNIVRADPRIVVTDRDRGAFSAVGQNFRYNSITVDTVNAGDPFGLNDNGLPTKGSPISPDAIEEYSISTANYDVSTRRGVGANVNAVTKSGTNNLHGSLYYSFQNADSMIGENQAGKNWSGFERTWTGGATVGGPIIKDTLFFFASYEETHQKSPGAIWGVKGSGATNEANIDQATLDQIVAIAKAKGMNPGGVEASNTDMTSKRALAKIDWNINSDHRASLRVSQTKEVEPIIVAGSANLLSLSSNWYVFDKKNSSATFSLYDNWTENFSTEFSFGRSKFTQNRDPLVGGAQPNVTVNTVRNGPGVRFGTEFSTQANRLEVESTNAYLAGNLYMGNHELKGGVDYQSDKLYNLFLQGYFGSYTFNSIAAWQAGTPVDSYTLNIPAPGYSLDNIAARFTMKQYGAFLQDTWQVNDNLSIQYGLRYDTVSVDPLPTFNPCFAAAPGTPVVFAQCATSIVNVNNPNAAKGGFGFTNQGTIDGLSVLQPRASFNYTFDTDLMLQFRGGIGRFISNTPAVWVANPYSGNGVARASYTTAANFIADPYGQVPSGTASKPGTGSARMAVDVVDPNFELPTVWKTSLGFDAETPWWGTVFTFDVEHINVEKGIFYQNLNLGAPTGVLPDGRYSYSRFPTQIPTSANQRWNANPSFGNSGSSTVIYLTNTDKGSATSWSVSLKKPMREHWSWMVGGTFSQSTEVNPGTSSVANSNYNNNYWYNPNEEMAAVSNYSIPKRLIASITWADKLFGDYETSISAFYDGHSGAPYSWAFGNDANNDGYFRDLAFVPGSLSDVEFTADVTQAQKDAFMAYIQNDKYLSEYMGKVFTRNGARSNWLNQLDLSIRQQIPGFFKGHKGEIRLDVFNFTNLLNKKWGVERRASFPLERYLADTAGYNPATGKWIYDINDAKYGGAGVYTPAEIPVNESQTPSQRWSLLMTVRYSF